MSSRGEYAYLRADPCSYCGASPGRCVDHIVPKARGGQTTSDNLTASCDACGTAKGAWPLLPFLLLKAWTAP
jgi:5-methylcytosine-specific restriction endonuclease McrA